MRVRVKHVKRFRARGRWYYYHRPTGTRLPDDPNSAEFVQRLAELDAQMVRPAEADLRGTIGALIKAYRAAPDFTRLAERTRKDYGRYLDFMGATFGDLDVSTVDREFVTALRDEYAETPRKANYLVAIIGVLMSFARERPKMFLLPPGWTNPAARPKRLRTGAGHLPWEEHQIKAFRARWPAETLERVLFEVFLNTGQRGGDIAGMTRAQIQGGVIAVTQSKTGARVEVPIAAELRAVLTPWLQGHQHMALFTTAKGGLKVDYMRHRMRDAIEAAGLPSSCTLHGLRYTFAIRTEELGLDWQTAESIVGHRTAEMARKYRAKKRSARIVIRAIDGATRDQKTNETG